MAKPKKEPVQVQAVGSLAAADFSGLARLLLRLNNDSRLKVVPSNEQPRRTVPSQQ
jgi:hypothetical protein